MMIDPAEQPLFFLLVWKDIRSCRHRWTRRSEGNKKREGYLFHRLDQISRMMYNSPPSYFFWWWRSLFMWRTALWKKPKMKGKIRSIKFPPSSAFFLKAIEEKGMPLYNPWLDVHEKKNQHLKRGWWSLKKKVDEIMKFYMTEMIL